MQDEENVVEAAEEIGGYGEMLEEAEERRRRRGRRMEGRANEFDRERERNGILVDRDDR